MAADDWASRVWNEREALLVATYGPSRPPGQPLGATIPFPEELAKVSKTPRGVVLVFPPTKKRAHWLYATHGLAQPLAPPPPIDPDAPPPPDTVQHAAP